MGKYIKLFNSHSDYEDFTESEDFILPNVSRCDSEKDVHYSPRPYDYSQDYLTFDIVSDGTLIWNYSYDLSFSSVCIDYSIDNGTTWSSICGSSTPFLNAVTGQKVLFKGVHSTYEVHQQVMGEYESTSYHFSGTASFNVSGNIMSMIGGDDFQNTTTFGAYAFRNLFSTCNVIDAKNLILPEITSQNCYDNMFYKCYSLATAPKLPSTTLAYQCYVDMFYNCTSLTIAPKLPATTLALGCYMGMFYGCTSLTTAPELPSTTLLNKCYQHMFYGCTSLTTAPELSATTLVSNCYSYMFQNCSNLNYIKALFTTTPSTSYTNNWVSGVASTGIFVKNSSAQWDVTGVNGVPTNWTVQTVNP